MLRPYARYLDFGGRSGRKEYWLFVLFYVLAYAAAFVVDLMLLGDNLFDVGGVGPASGLFWILSIIPSIAVAVRRLHDTNRSGWWLLAAFIPLIGGFLLLAFMIQRGTPDANRFGPPDVVSSASGQAAPAAPAAAT